MEELQARCAATRAAITDLKEGQGAVPRLTARLSALSADEGKFDRLISGLTQHKAQLLSRQQDAAAEAGERGE